MENYKMDSEDNEATMGDVTNGEAQASADASNTDADNNTDGADVSPDGRAATDDAGSASAADDNAGSDQDGEIGAVTSPVGVPEVGEGVVTFVSREKEPVQFSVMGISPTRSPDGRLEWEVPEDKADSFQTHHHCHIQRILRKD